MQKIFNIFSPIVSAIGEIEKNTFKRIEKNGIWYIANVENSGDHIYAITKNKNGMSGNKVKFKTENGEIFEETGVWHTSSDSLFSKTGIDLREKHYFEYIVSKEKEGSLKPYSGSLYIDIVDYKEKHLGNPYNFENILSELMNKHKCNLYYAQKTSGGGSDGLKKYKKIGKTMQKSVVEILENILDETKREHKNYEGGRKKYLNDLQDSDEFHNESHSEGEIYTLEKLIEIFRDKKVEKLNIPMSEDERKSRQKASEDHFKAWWDSEGKEKFEELIYDRNDIAFIKKVCEESWSNGSCIALDKLD